MRRLIRALALALALLPVACAEGETPMKNIPLQESYKKAGQNNPL